MEQGITKLLFNKLLSETNNDYKLEKLQQKYMESKEINYSTTRHQGLRPKIIDFGWIDHQQWNE
jgi:hypothetical protein